MSGTSVNSIDAVVADLGPAGAPRLIAGYEYPFPQALRQQLLRLNQPGDNELDRLAQLDSLIARHFAKAVKKVLDKANLGAAAIRAIGCHGQTVRHAPDASEPYTVQIGNPSLLAELSGILTVADFRRRDMAAGGQGAPLAPAFHQAFFASKHQHTVVVNIGGIANLTLLPAGTDTEVSGFDTGPGNTLLDAWIARHTGQAYDDEGLWGAGGQILTALLDKLLQDSYFQRLPPKSTGPEYFNLEWLQKKNFPGFDRELAPQDIQATLTALSAQTITRAIKRHAPLSEQVFICGGGVHNRTLLRQIQQLLDPVPVRSSAAAGIDPDYMEALGFAWLAKQTLAGRPGNIPAVTGAAGRRILGGIYPA